MKDFKANVYLFENNAANYNTKQRYSFYLEQLINLLYIESFAYLVAYWLRVMWLINII